MIYRQGDEKVFEQDSEEYVRLSNIATILTKHSPNKHIYTVKDTYIDYGQDWMWTTIVDTVNGAQILNSKIWLDIVNDCSIDEIIHDITTNDYWQGEAMLG